MKITDFKISLAAQSDEEAWENLKDILKIVSPEFFSIEDQKTDGTRKVYMERSIQNSDEGEPVNEKQKNENEKEAETILKAISQIFCESIHRFSEEKDIKKFLSDFLIPLLKTQKPNKQ